MGIKKSIVKEKSKYELEPNKIWIVTYYHNGKHKSKEMKGSEVPKAMAELSKAIVPHWAEEKVAEEIIKKLKEQEENGKLVGGKQKQKSK